ncbi:hypothetical protein [Pikeienuella sp. HZG-20]|uniref:hypothetical protein n=1 Tax=Paludibacillus litoralis TaxID=3133267 RepID=UPI0030ECF4E7
MPTEPTTQRRHFTAFGPEDGPPGLKNPRPPRGGSRVAAAPRAAAPALPRAALIDKWRAAADRRRAAANALGWTEGAPWRAEADAYDACADDLRAANAAAAPNGEAEGVVERLAMRDVMRRDPLQDDTVPLRNSTIAKSDEPAESEARGTRPQSIVNRMVTGTGGPPPPAPPSGAEAALAIALPLLRGEFQIILESNSRFERRDGALRRVPQSCEREELALAYRYRIAIRAAERALGRPDDGAPDWFNAAIDGGAL